MPTGKRSGDGSFFGHVYRVVQKVPRGRVATYGQVAASMGAPRAAQAVGWALAVCDPQAVPWQRVVAKGGWLTIVNEHLAADLQASLLEREGVAVRREGHLWRVKNLPEVLWEP